MDMIPDSIPGTALPPPAQHPPPLCPAAAPPPKRRRRKSGLQLALVAVSLALLLMCGVLAFALLSLRGGFGALFAQSAHNTAPPAGSFSVVRVVGTIQNAGGGALGIGEPSYQHAATLAHIRQCAESEGNAGILLYMNTPGGGVYESDEVYLALMDYREKTGRPVWAFMADTCASGGYYICAAADHIAANRSTITGSIGVYIQMTDSSGLYEKLGLETVLVRSGDNKGTGMAGVPITAAQQAVYQGIVDEYYERFVDIVAEGRGMSASAAHALSDGRVYTATQALENGLIDEVGNWERTLAAFEEETGAVPFYPNFSRQTLAGQLLNGLRGALPQGEAETLLGYAESLQNGVPMALYNPS